MSRSLAAAMAELSISSSSSTLPRSGIFHCVGREDQCREPHFLDACFLCKKPLGQNRDIYMYRGDQPFCTKDCRQRQIDMDEAKEKRWRLSSSSTRNLRNAETTENSSSSKTVRTSTVVVA